MGSVKRISIYYFSGTGNAQHVAKWFAEAAVELNIISETFNIAETNARILEQVNKDSLIIIISPIHGFNYPKITLDFIRRFPAGNNKVVLMNTRAGMRIGSIVTPGLTGIAFMLASLILKSKGYKISGQIPFDMPSNWISIHPALREKSVITLYAKNYSKVRKHAKKILSGKSDFTALRDIVQDTLISPIAIGYYIIGRYFFAKTYYASNKCDDCGVCIENCPVNAIIRIGDRPFWTFKCESCMKCMNYCPRRAIETSHGLVALVIVISLLFNSFFFSQQIAGGILPGIVEFILRNALFILFLGILYRFQHLLLRNSFIVRIISAGSLTFYKFWGRYKSIPDRKWKEPR